MIDEGSSLVAVSVAVAVVMASVSGCATAGTGQSEGDGGPAAEAGGAGAVGAGTARTEAEPDPAASGGDQGDLEWDRSYEPYEVRAVVGTPDAGQRRIEALAGRVLAAEGDAEQQRRFRELMRAIETHARAWVPEAYATSVDHDEPLRGRLFLSGPPSRPVAEFVPARLADRIEVVVDAPSPEASDAGGSDVSRALEELGAFVYELGTDPEGGALRARVYQDTLPAQELEDRIGVDGLVVDVVEDELQMHDGVIDGAMVYGRELQIPVRGSSLDGYESAVLWSVLARNVRCEDGVSDPARAGDGTPIRFNAPAVGGRLVKAPPDVVIACGS